jgi:4-amino-4-deoxy-L-arabinose transferase-like glycosyltransferase
VQAPERHASLRALPALTVAALTAVGVALRVAMADQSVFADELSTYWIVSTNDLAGVVSTVHSDAEISPPLPFLAAWLTTQIDLTPELLRLPSLVAGALTIPVVYLLGLRTVGRPAALVAAALTALAPFMAYYSAEARGYALMMALVALSTLAMLIAVDKRRARWWILYAACTCGAVYSHYTCVFALGAQLLWVLWAHPEARRPALLATGAAAVAFGPWLSGLLADLDSPTTNILSALQPFDAEHVRLSLEHSSVGYPYSVVGLRELPGTTALVLIAAGVAVAIAGLVATRARGRAWRDLVPGGDRALLVFALALSVPVAAAVVSAAGPTDLFSTRNLAASWPAFALSLAALLVSAGPRLRVLAAGLVVVGFAIGAAKLLQDRFERPPFEATAQFVDRSARPGDVVIDETGVVSPGPLSHIDLFLDRPGRVFRAGAPQQRDHPFTAADPIVSPAQAARRAVAAAAGGRIFHVTGARGALLTHPPRGYRQVELRTYPGIVTLEVRVYAPRAS